MLKRKTIRARGKVSFSKFLQPLKAGDRVALIRELSFTAAFPKRWQGKTGVVMKKQGEAYLVEVNDLNMKKHLVVRPIHLKKIEMGVTK